MYPMLKSQYTKSKNEGKKFLGPDFEISSNILFTGRFDR